jgi:2-polyprenyl-6-methoxyphenol hydroxylase-like FAD-dependent oxidoreductase
LAYRLSVPEQEFVGGWRMSVGHALQDVLEPSEGLDETATGEVLVGADGINSATLQLAWPNPRPRRWTEVTCFRGLIPRTVVASLRKADGSPLDHNPIKSFSMDRHRNDRSGATTYWVRGGELLNVWIARYEPNSAAFEQEEGDWLPVSQEENLAYRWFCRLGIEAAVPDHSAFSRARNERFREGDVFRRVFERVVEACIAAGSGWWRRLCSRCEPDPSRRQQAALDRGSGLAQGS